SRRRHTRSKRDWSSDVCSSDLNKAIKKTIQPAATKSCQPILMRYAKSSSHLCIPHQESGNAIAADISTNSKNSFDNNFVMLETRSEERRVGKECMKRRREDEDI